MTKTQMLARILRFKDRGPITKNTDLLTIPQYVVDKKEFSEVKEDGGSCNVDLLESALTDLRNAIRLAPQNLELHR